MMLMIIKKNVKDWIFSAPERDAAPPCLHFALGRRNMLGPRIARPSERIRTDSYDNDDVDEVCSSSESIDVAHQQH